MEKIILQISHHLLEKINSLADASDLSFNDYVTQLLEDIPENNNSQDLKSKNKTNNQPKIYE